MRIGTRIVFVRCKQCNSPHLEACPTDELSTVIIASQVEHKRLDGNTALEGGNGITFNVLAQILHDT